MVEPYISTTAYKVNIFMNSEHESENEIDDRTFNTYIEMQKEVSKREFSLYEQVDKYLFTLSSAGLGFSIAFIKGVINLSTSSSNWVLFSSWFCFMIAIVLNLVSYSPAKKALRFQRERIVRYYLGGDTSVLGEINIFSVYVDRLRFFFSFTLYFSLDTNFGIYYIEPKQFY